jgi:CAI-1 autoinducer synthase
MALGEQTVALRDWRLPPPPSALESVNQRFVEWKSGYAAANLIVVGRKPGAGAILLAGNDYLSLARHPEIVRAITQALLTSRADVLMSTVYVQHLDVQRQFEADIAAYLGSEAAVLCQSGWSANDGLIQVLADSEMPVYIDIAAHASLWQGIQSAGAAARPFRHNDPASLSTLIKRYGPGLIVADAVYSTTGDICPLGDFVDIAERQGCMLVLDESHAVGVRGPGGTGLAAELGLIDHVHFRTFSLSKAFVGRGGIVAGPSRLMEYFRFVARPSVFSSAVMLHEIAAFSATLEIIRSDERRRATLRQKSTYLRAGLLAAGWPIANNDAPIIALMGGAEERTVRLRDALEDRNVFGAVFCAPSTAKNRSLVRLTMNASLPDSDLDTVIDACAAARQEMGPG